MKSVSISSSSAACSCLRMVDEDVGCIDLHLRHSVTARSGGIVPGEIQLLLLAVQDSVGYRSTSFPMPRPAHKKLMVHPSLTASQQNPSRPVSFKVHFPTGPKTWTRNMIEIGFDFDDHNNYQQFCRYQHMTTDLRSLAVMMMTRLPDRGARIFLARASYFVNPVVECVMTTSNLVNDLKRVQRRGNILVSVRDMSLAACGQRILCHQLSR